jgi:hypothetical protein
MFWGEVLSAAEKHNRTSSIRTTQAATLLPHHIAMNTIREIEKINQQELERGIAGTPASWHAQYANSAWCYVGNLDHQLTEGDVLVGEFNYRHYDCVPFSRAPSHNLPI